MAYMTLEAERAYRRLVLLLKDKARLLKEYRVTRFGQFSSVWHEIAYENRLKSLERGLTEQIRIMDELIYEQEKDLYELEAQIRELEVKP